MSKDMNNKVISDLNVGDFINESFSPKSESFSPNISDFIEKSVSDLKWFKLIKMIKIWEMFLENTEICEFSEFSDKDEKIIDSLTEEQDETVLKLSKHAMWTVVNQIVKEMKDVFGGGDEI